MVGFSSNIYRRKRKGVSMLIELTMFSQDSENGKKILVHADDIRSVSTVEVFEEKIPQLKDGMLPKKKTISLIRIANVGMQTVQESMEEVRKLVDGPEIKVETYVGALSGT